MNVVPRYADPAFDAWAAAEDSRVERVVIEKEIDFSETVEVSAEGGLLTVELIRDEDHEPLVRDTIVIPLGNAEEVAAAIVRAARRGRQ